MPLIRIYKVENGLSRLAAGVFLTAALAGACKLFAQPTANAAAPKIDALIRRLAPPKARVGVALYSVRDRAFLCESRSDVPLVLASNTKLFTTAAATLLLGPSFEWVTPLAARGTRDAAGVLHGDLVVVGSGDPNFSGRFHNDNPTAVFERWAADLLAENIREVDGDLVLDDTAFDREFYLEPWAQEYAGVHDVRMEWYAAEIGGLAFNDDCIDLTLGAGAAPGAPIQVSMSPKTDYVRLAVTAKTVKGRGDNDVAIRRPPEANDIRVSGVLGAEVAPGVHYVTIHDPVMYFGTVLKETLERRGVKVRGVPKPVPAGYVSALNPATYVTEHRSPLPRTLQVINRRSQNFYAEQLLKTLGWQKRGRGTRVDGLAVVQEALRTLDLPDPPALEDGSGLARGNKATPRTLALLLAKMLYQPPDRMRMFAESLALPGEEGTLKKRFTEPAYRTRVKGKTGFIGGVSNLAGYLQTKSGKDVAFAILMNDVTDLARAHELQDLIVKAVIDNE